MTYQKALEERGTQRKAAASLGIPQSTFHARLTKERQGLPDGPTKIRETDAPASIIPDGYRVKGTSTMYDADGVPRMQWVKTDVDREMMERLLTTAREEFARTVKPLPLRARVIPVPDSELMTVYVLTDHHLGMLAWGEETGADYDIKIAERLLVDYFTRAAQLTPNSKTAVLANIGDIMHFDGILPVTPSSGHVLDADTRFQKLIRVAIRAIRIAIDILLTKHETVKVIHATGNHDLSSSAWLRECFEVLYSNNPNVTIDVRPDPYYAVEHGLTSVFFHHGHRRKVGNIDTVFAGKFREVFGRTKYSYAHLGHLHSVDRRETNIMIVEQHPTLAAPDAYAAGGGWLSKRSASAITYSAVYGEVSRITITPEMFK